MRIFTNGGRRKYFRLTEVGKKLCSEILNDWNKSKLLIDKLISNNEKRTEFKREIKIYNTSPAVKTIK
jgi:DNA-binding PadR family transcriptional regulator